MSCRTQGRAMELGNMTVKNVRPSKTYQKYFDKTNRLYFESKLPPTKVLIAPLLKVTQFSQKEALSGNWKEKDAGVYGLCGKNENDEWCIILDKGTSVFHPMMTKTTILHEQIHLYIPHYNTHGKLFKAQIRRIAALGALDDLV